MENWEPVRPDCRLPDRKRAEGDPHIQGVFNGLQKGGEVLKRGGQKACVTPRTV